MPKTSKCLNMIDKKQLYKIIRQRWKTARYYMGYAEYRLSLGCADWQDIRSKREIKQNRKIMRVCAFVRKFFAENL